MTLVRHVRDGHGPVVLGLDADGGVSVSLDDQTVVVEGLPTEEGESVRWLLACVPLSGHSHKECGCQQEDARLDAVVTDEDLPGIVGLLDRLPRPDRASDYADGWYLPEGGAWLWRGRTGSDGRAVVERVAEDDRAMLVVLEEVSVGFPRRHE